MTLRAIVLEILADHPGQYVKGADIVREVRRRYPEVANKYHSDLGISINKRLRSEMKWGNVERRTVTRRTVEWRLVR